MLELHDNTDFSTVVCLSKCLLLHTAYKLYFHGPGLAERHNLKLCDSFVLTMPVTYSGFLIFEARYPVSLKHGVPFKTLRISNNFMGSTMACNYGLKLLSTSYCKQKVKFDIYGTILQF
ncbi:hypothetical protein CDAR_445601 [Caerostris darwini]|uniref:Uncharacterized protein n=1 Tax=Caerostris darwini TaxID=1538125 RepID=A0AAV4U7F6_9ARAC|nr:hypothetical protein CDAR_445601 [Caerostris darwini]